MCIEQYTNSELCMFTTYLNLKHHLMSQFSESAFVSFREAFIYSYNESLTLLSLIFLSKDLDPGILKSFVNSNTVSHRIAMSKCTNYRP